MGDIKTGKISKTITIPAEIREKLEKKMKPAPKRAADLQKEFEKGFEGKISNSIFRIIDHVSHYF